MIILVLLFTEQDEKKTMSGVWKYLPTEKNDVLSLLYV